MYLCIKIQNALDEVEFQLSPLLCDLWQASSLLCLLTSFSSIKWRQ